MGPESGVNQNQRTPPSAYLWWCPWICLIYSVAYPLLWHPDCLDYAGIWHSFFQSVSPCFCPWRWEHWSEELGRGEEGMLYTRSSPSPGFRNSWGAQLNIGAGRHSWVQHQRNELEHFSYLLIILKQVKSNKDINIASLDRSIHATLHKAIIDGSATSRQKSRIFLYQFPYWLLGILWLWQSSY